MDSDDSLITRDHITQLGRSEGRGHRSAHTRARGTLMQGVFFAQQLAEGLSIHGADATERQETDSSAEIAEQISLTIVLQGPVAFSLRNQQFQLQPESKRKPACALLVVDEPELFTRHLKTGNHVRKITLTLGKAWLACRVLNQADRQHLQNLWASAPFVSHWQGDEQTSQLADNILQHCNNDTLESRFKLEIASQKLLHLILPRLLNDPRFATPRPSQAPAASVLPGQDNDALKQRVEEKLTAPEVTLKGIATSLGMSVSTLQRRFKSQYHITVMEYLRYRKLEQARAALLIDGISIGEAAFSAGYNHPSNFTMAFKKAFGETPSALLGSKNIAYNRAPPPETTN